MYIPTAIIVLFLLFTEVGRALIGFGIVLSVFALFIGFVGLLCVIGYSLLTQVS